MSPLPADGQLRLVRLYPDLLGTYGDDGNAIVLAQRARWRGIEATITDVTAGADVPDDAHVYLIGGGEDGPQTSAAAFLTESGALHRALDRGAALLAICAGFQLIGKSFVGPNGLTTAGVGLLDVATHRTVGDRIVGEVTIRSDPDLGVGDLSGYENHAGVTKIGPGARPLGTVTSGTGNGTGDQSEGAWQDRIIATYLHGPVLARNPRLADRLLGWALDIDAIDLPTLDDSIVDALRRERFDQAGRRTQQTVMSRSGAIFRRIRPGASQS